jgi:hypothetical protein
MHRRVSVSALTELGPVDWDSAVAGCGEPFRFSHRAAAGTALESAYDSYRFTPVRVEFGDGTVLLLPLVRVTRRLAALSMALGMPLSLEGRPLAVSGTAQPEHLETLFGELGWCGLLEISGGAGGSPPDAGKVSRQTTHILELAPGYEALWTNTFPAKTRNMCRKAERGGVAVAPDRSAAAVASYQELYRASALGWGYEEPPYPDGLFEALLASDHAELWLARAEQQIVAGAVMLRGSDDLFYWSGAMNREFRHLAPSNAIIRAVIEDACTRGITYLDFGASTGLSGVEAFKRSFGAAEREYSSVELTRPGYRRLERWGSRAARVRGGGKQAV